MTDNWQELGAAARVAQSYMIAASQADKIRLEDMIEAVDAEITRTLQSAEAAEKAFGVDLIDPAWRRRIAVQEAILRLLKAIRARESAVRTALNQPKERKRV